MTRLRTPIPQALQQPHLYLSTAIIVCIGDRIASLLRGLCGLLFCFLQVYPRAVLALERVGIFELNPVVEIVSTLA
jgi:hypothetical protein